MNSNLQKFESWVSKANSTISECAEKGSSSTRCAVLRDAAKYVKYWGMKIQTENSELFREKVSKSEKQALEQSADCIIKYYKECAGLAREKRKLGSKGRVDELFKLAYYAESSAIPFWVRSGNLEKVRAILHEIVSDVAPEIPVNSERFRIRTIARLLDYATRVGESVPTSLKERFAIGADDQSIVRQECSNIIRRATDALATQDTISALILSDQALELFLRFLCRVSGCSDDTISKTGSRRQFPKWGFVEYMIFLEDKEIFTPEQKSDFLTYHDWRNKVQHLGIEPSARQTTKVISNIQDFMEQWEES